MSCVRCCLFWITSITPSSCRFMSETWSTSQLSIKRCMRRYKAETSGSQTTNILVKYSKAIVQLRPRTTYTYYCCLVKTASTVFTNLGQKENNTVLVVNLQRWNAKSKFWRKLPYSSFRWCCCPCCCNSLMSSWFWTTSLRNWDMLSSWRFSCSS